MALFLTGPTPSPGFPFYALLRRSRISLRLEYLRETTLAGIELVRQRKCLISCEGSIVVEAHFRILNESQSTNAEFANVGPFELLTAPLPYLKVIVMAERLATKLTEAAAPSPVITPRVSIIIPCYKTSGLVPETLRSVFAQTYRDFEVVLVNDGAPDAVELEQAIAPWRGQTTYVHTENWGPAGARNNGINAACGEFIALLDSDDIWEPNYLEVQVSQLDQHPDADIVYANAVLFGQGSQRYEVPRSRGEVTFKSLVQERCVVLVSVLARRSALERAGLFDSSLRSCEDFDMWLRCVKSGSRIIYHKQVLVRYRLRPGSLSSDYVRMSTDAIRVLHKMRTAVSMTDEEREALEDALVRFKGKRLFFEGKRAFNDSDVPNAVELLQKSNTYLHSFRVSLIVLLLRALPNFARTAYRWRSRMAGYQESPRN